MRSRLRFVAATAVAVGLAVSFSQGQTPVSTAFTYQGLLQDQGSAATGVCDLQFRLFDSATGSTQIGSTLCANDVTVTAGTFTVSLDFGQQFSGSSRYLEILVRSQSQWDCSVASGYTTLSPRQELTTTPFATYAMTAGIAETATQAQTALLASDTQRVGGQPASNVALLNANQSFSGLLQFSNPNNIFAGSGAGLTQLNASNIHSGTLSNARTTGTTSATADTLMLRDAGGFAYANGFFGPLFGNASSATNASQLNGLAPSYYTDASNINAGVLANARTTGTDLNNAATLVLRDGSGNFSAGTITANLTGTATNATQLNGLAPSAYLPPTVLAWNNASLGGHLLAGASPTTMTSTSQSLTFAAGPAVVSWSITASCSSVISTVFTVRVRIGANVGPWTTYAFSEPNVHASISGNATIPVAAGDSTISLEILRTAGPGGFVTDANDSLTGSIINIRQ